MKVPRKGTAGFLYVNYHWIIAAVMVMMIFVHGGSMNNFSTLHLIPITERLSIARADFALAYSFKNIASMISTFFSGFIIAKWGSRITTPVGLMLLGVSYVIVANVKSLPMLMVGCVIMGASYGFCTTSGAVAVVRLWFHRHEGTVLGVVTAASGIGGSLLSIAQTAVMEKGGFQASLYLCAGLAFGLVVLSFLLLRNRPEDMGLLPLGDGERRGKRPTSVGFAGLPMNALWKQPVFYLLLFCVMLSSFSLYLAFNVVRNFFVDCDFSAAQATGLYSAMLLLVT
ncbi:MAG: MFS transporter, partial [Oscillospiraceae bacterium]|nr:MFS transporter [Oscillospiraceae bacterium]